MMVVLSGTNRPDSNTRRVAALCEQILRSAGEDVTLLDLCELPPGVFAGEAYASKPNDFAPFQQAILDAAGVLVVVPEYNGSFPGIVKYFIDMLRFPESLYEKPAGFVGLASGRFGAVRAVEQLEMVFQYRHAHLFGRRCFFPAINQYLDEDGRFSDTDYGERLHEMVTGFADFCRRLTE